MTIHEDITYDQKSVQECCDYGGGRGGLVSESPPSVADGSPTSRSEGYGAFDSLKECDGCSRTSFSPSPPASVSSASSPSSTRTSSPARSEEGCRRRAQRNGSPYARKRSPAATDTDTEDDGEEVHVGEVPVEDRLTGDICDADTSNGLNGVLRPGVDEGYVPRLRYPDLAAQIFIHGGALYGFYLACTSCHLVTILWAFCTVYTSAFGITAGVHRLWSHKAFKANWPLRVILMLLFTVTGQRHIYAWALDHRVHHRYSETDADPHDARRGFLFAHVGWLVVTPHPAVERARKQVDMSDLHADPVVMWQKKWYEPLFALLTIGVPVLIPVYWWQESLWASFWVNFNARFSFTLNVAFLINSLAHTHGFRPYDKSISPVESPILGLLAVGEGWHNFHHVFPWDYRTGELGGGRINATTHLIDAFAGLGWAYDLRAAQDRVVKHRVQRCGDGSGGGLFGAGKRPPSPSSSSFSGPAAAAAAAPADPDPDPDPSPRPSPSHQ